MNDKYIKTFNTPEGRAVLSDLERIINLTKIDSDNPNPNSALYKCAQLALLNRIMNQLKS
jgi:ribosomal protein S12